MALSRRLGAGGKAPILIWVLQLLRQPDKGPDPNLSPRSARVVRRVLSQPGPTGSVEPLRQLARGLWALFNEQKRGFGVGGVPAPGRGLELVFKVLSNHSVVRIKAGHLAGKGEVRP